MGAVCDVRCGLNEHVWCVAQLRPRCCPPGTAACAQLPRQHWCAELRLCSPGRTGACGRPLARRREGDITRRRCAVPTQCGARKSGTSCYGYRQGQSPHCPLLHPHLSSASAAKVVCRRFVSQASDVKPGHRLCSSSSRHRCAGNGGETANITTESIHWLVLRLLLPVLLQIGVAYYASPTCAVWCRRRVAWRRQAACWRRWP